MQAGTAAAVPLPEPAKWLGLAVTGCTMLSHSEPWSLLVI